MATTNAYTAAQTLRLPELLALILGFHTEASSLASCMRVNSLWAQEAAMILWQSCGYQLRRIGEPRAPAIRDLAALSHRPDRFQRYANYIHTLEFDIEDFFRDDVRREHYELRDEARFHSTLTDITFTHLEHVKFWSSDGGYLHNKTSLLLQYLQTGLKSFLGFGSFGNGAILSDQFFSTMKNRCRSLENLELTLDIEHSSESEIVSKEGFAQFLNDMKHLFTLSICRGFDDVMTSEAFGYLLQYQYLTHLELPNVPEQWIRDLDPLVFPSGGPFPNITDFTAGLSDGGLELLLPYLRNVTNLQIRPFGQFINAIGILANAQLTALEHLSVDVIPDTIIRGADLVLLAKSTRKLDYLYIPGNPDETDRLPFATSVTDAVMNELASHLPNIQYLCLKMKGSSLTEASLISLGEHCKHLESCYISADVFFEELVRMGRPNLFPVLDELFVTQLESDRREYTNVELTAELLVSVFPKLDYFQWYGNESPLDLDFSIAAYQAILTRRRGL